MCEHPCDDLRCASYSERRTTISSRRECQPHVLPLHGDLGVRNLGVSATATSTPPQRPGDAEPGPRKWEPGPPCIGRQNIAFRKQGAGELLGGLLEAQRGIAAQLHGGKLLLNFARGSHRHLYKPSLAQSYCGRSCNVGAGWPWQRIARPWLRGQAGGRAPGGSIVRHKVAKSLVDTAFRRLLLATALATPPAPENNKMTEKPPKSSKA